MHNKKQRAPAILDEIKRTDNKRLARGEPAQLNQVWVDDVTYIRYQKRWWYLAVVMDVFSRKIIGWALDTHRRQDLTMQALRQAIGNRRRTSTLLFHSDRGVEYGASRYREMLADHQIMPSMNRPGHCTDNAHIESFFHSLKAEWFQCDQYANVTELRAAIRWYIVNFYNNVRLHSSLGFRSPNEFERKFCN